MSDCGAAALPALGQYLHVLMKGFMAAVEMVDEGHVDVSTHSFAVRVPAQTWSLASHHMTVQKLEEEKSPHAA